MAQAIDVSAVLSKQDVSGLMREINRNAELLGRDMGPAVGSAGWFVADSLRVSTKLAPKKRKMKKLPRSEMDRWHKSRPGWSLYLVDRWYRGTRQRFRLYAKGKRAANKSPRVVIGKRGLAAKAWHWAAIQLGRGTGAPKVSGKASAIAKRQMKVTKNIKSVAPWVKIVNSLDYASQAFKSQGDQTLNSVMARATSRLAKFTDRRIAKRMGAK